MKPGRPPLKIIPYYTGIASLEKALLSPEGKKVLFLEILFNESVPWEDFLHHPEVKRAYAQARGWFARYETAVSVRGLRLKPLPALVRSAKPARENERLFWEALYFAEGKRKRSRKAS